MLCLGTESPAQHLRPGVRRRDDGSGRQGSRRLERRYASLTAETGSIFRIGATPVINRIEALLCLFATGAKGRLVASAKQTLFCHLCARSVAGYVSIGCPIFDSSPLLTGL